MVDCSRTRILTGLLIAIAIVCAILVGILIWREESRHESTDTSFSSSVATKWYPGLFRTPTEQQTYAARYLDTFYNNRKVVNATDPTRGDQQCFTNCQTIEGRRKKRVALQQIYHGCCASAVSFIYPSTHTNLGGQLRNLVQFGTTNQYFAVHSCLTVSRCGGCTCSQEQILYTAVVVKSGVSHPDDIEDTEIDYFYMDGCCKCVNT